MMNHDNSFLAVYKERLLKRREESQAKKAEKEKPLLQKIEEWHKSLSPADRQRPFSMDELVHIFKRPPSAIGQNLHKLGWKRFRVWGDGPYRRLWLAKIDYVHLKSDTPPQAAGCLQP